MKAMKTLLWIETRKHTRLLIFLTALLIVWFVSIPSVANLLNEGNFHISSSDSETWSSIFLQEGQGSLTQRFLLLSIGLLVPGLLGFLAVCFTFLGTGKEGRGGQLGFLLLTPQSSVVHVTSRFLFMFCLCAIYFGCLIFSASFAYAPLSAFSTQFLFATCVFSAFLVLIIAPICASAVLSDVVLASYRTKGNTLLPILTMAIGWSALTAKVTTLTSHVGGRFFSKLPLPLPIEYQDAMQLPSLSVETLLVTSLLSIVFLSLAAWVWESLEA